MERIPEPELMDEKEQARAYAAADFGEPHQRFVELFRTRFPDAEPRSVLDLGCGPGDVSRRFARAYPACRILGIDGSQAMLDEGVAITAREGLAERVELRLGMLPSADLGAARFDTLIVNSLLHHLQDPAVLWRSLLRYGEPESAIFVMDLTRPDTAEEAHALVERYAAGEPEILRCDFLASLHAAYRPDEVSAQLAAHDLAHLSIEIVSDRHFIVHGRLGPA